MIRRQLYEDKGGNLSMNSPAEIAKNYVGIGKGKVETPALKLFILGIMAGIFIGIGAIAYQMSTATIGGSLGKLVGACMFPAGLSLVLIAGSELFTGNCLLVIPLLEKEVKLTGVLRNWLLVFLGNFAGSIILALLIVYSHTPSQVDGALLDTMMSVASAKVGLSFGDALLRGIICNIMVCLAVWMSFAGKTVPAKIMGLYFPIMIFVLGGFEHNVANMYYLSAGIFANSVYAVGNTAVNWGAALLNNLLPVTIGNIIGGALVGSTYWFIYLRGAKKN